MITPDDRAQLTRHGITNEKLEWQLNIFRQGVPYMKLKRVATLGDGILQISEAEKKELVSKYDAVKEISKLKFIPASGAASRMFKALFEYIDKGVHEDSPSDKMVAQFFTSIKSFAFYDELAQIADKKGKSLTSMLASKQYIEILELLLDEVGLNYGFLPKGLLKFHRYETTSRTPFEEHLVEAAEYARTEGIHVYLHFTVSPEHKNAFTDLLENIKSDYEKRFGVTFIVDFSLQKPSTDTIAVDLKNEPFRNPDGTLFFRPGGHGALIDNLNELDADIIFIKNIDNVVPEKFLDNTVTYKKILAGKLLEIQEQVFGILRELDNSDPSPSRLKEIKSFINNHLNYEFIVPPDLHNIKATCKIFHNVLDRPIRVCGVVKNLGEPGGGPFWAPNSIGDISLQIIESSQVNKEDKAQIAIFDQATHFNPVDLVCATKSYKGEKFKLHNYIDSNTCFISHKSKDGKDLKALELPGLWNGSMADWLTIFIEVPVETFNPVKTVNDLLRLQHQ